VPSGVERDGLVPCCTDIAAREIPHIDRLMVASPAEALEGFVRAMLHACSPAGRRADGNPVSQWPLG
jgi:hypothetical protein